MANLNNTTPRSIQLGTKDEGGVQVYPALKKESLWKPKVFAFAAKGDSSVPYDVTGDEFSIMFGSETIDPRSKFFNHQLFMANTVFKNGGSIIFQKLEVPVDGTIAGSTPAGVTVWALVTEIDVPTYVRDVDGKIALPAVEDGTTPGYNIAFVASDKVENPEIILAGATGNTLDGVDAVTYPLFSFESIGGNAVYNNTGVTLSPLTGDNNDSVVLSERRAFQLRAGIVTKETGVVKYINTLLGLNGIDCTFKPFTIDPTTNAPISIDDLLPSSWENFVDTDLPMSAAPLKDIDIHEGLEVFTTNLSGKEYTYITDNGIEDFFSLGNDEWDADDRSTGINWMSLIDPENENEYHTSIISPAPAVTFGTTLTDNNGAVIDISDDTPFYLRGGLDGNVASLALYEQALLQKIAEYADVDSRVQSIPLNEENVFIDTGFSLDTSLKLPMLQYFRKDIEVVLATYEFSTTDRDGVDLDRDITSAALLRNALSLTPESKEYNTPASRGIIVQGCGKDTTRIYPYLLPNTIELAYQSSLYMGGSSWNSRYEFGGQPGSLFKALTDIRPADLPFSVKTRLHSTGVMYGEVEDRGNWFFPSYQGIYMDPTSPLVSYHTNMAITYFVKLHHRMWRKYTGRGDLSQGELKALIEADMQKSLGLDKFNNEFTEIRPEVYFLEYDTQVGHIWRQRIYVSRNNERNVAISDTVVRRPDTLEGGA